MRETRIVCDICKEEIFNDYIELKAVKHITMLLSDCFRINSRIAICEKCKDSLVTMVKNQREWEEK